MESCDLVILLYACYTVDKYRQQMITINDTWGKKCQEYPTRIRLLYFLGEEQREDPEFQDTPVTKYIHLPGVQDDYLSASYKQWLGMKYVYDHYKPNFIHCMGTDTYMNVPKFLRYLEIFDPNQLLFVGGHGDCRQVGPGKPCYFHSGGPGFVITYGVLQCLYHLLPHITDTWRSLCHEHHVEYLQPACDVAIAYYLQQPNSPVHVLKADEEFMSCNYVGWPCHLGQINLQKLLVCHLMDENACRDFSKLLEANNYFLTL
jgi:hypothetical protein